MRRHVAKKVYSDEEMMEKEGAFMSDEGVLIFNEDVDLYREDGALLCKFRKNVLRGKQRAVLMRLQGAASLGATRPSASGIPEEGKYKYVVSQSSGKTLRVLTTKARSGVVGFYDTGSNFGAYHNRSGAKCRTTAYTAKHLEKYQDCLPVFKKIDRTFRRLVPVRYRIQKKAAAGIDPAFVIQDTIFTTVTVNKNFRTALHRDAGDLREGFGNLVVVSEGEYTGAYTMFPQYGVGVDCRSGDFLAMDVHAWHCNSEMSGEGTRVSLVFYLREKIVRMCPAPPAVAEALENI
jgi:hypothetical protein